jgi:type II secretory pathway pseudopilin PulG
LELVVVLVILVALAGILVPLLPGMLGRAHTAEHGTNITEINKAVEAFNLINRSYPDGLDRLDTAYTVMPDGSATDACNSQLVDVALVADDVTALNNAGVTRVWALAPASTDLVTAPYAAAAPALLVAPDNVAGLSVAAATRLYNDVSATSKYVVFGFGPGCEMIGKPGGIPESPLHFSDEKAAAGDPTKTYARFGLVFRVADTAGVSLETAQFVGTVALHEAGISNANDAAAEYHAQNPQ